MFDGGHGVWSLRERFDLVLLAGGAPAMCVLLSWLLQPAPLYGWLICEVCVLQTVSASPACEVCLMSALCYDCTCCFVACTTQLPWQCVVVMDVVAERCVCAWCVPRCYLLERCCVVCVVGVRVVTSPTPSPRVFHCLLT